MKFVIYPFSFSEFLELYHTVDPNATIQQSFQKYLLSGGMPYLANLQYAEEPSRQYLTDIFNSVQLETASRIQRKILHCRPWHSRGGVWREYARHVQVAYLLATEETVTREFGVYNLIRDNFPKYVVTMDEIDMSRNGIKHRIQSQVQTLLSIATRTRIPLHGIPVLV